MKKCIICGNLHRRTCQTCCKECNEIFKKQKDDEQQKVIKEQGGDCCKICGRYTHGMLKHLKSAHNLTVEQYNTKYNDNVDKFSQYWKTENKKHGFKPGKDNPAYQHGGRLSPFSDKFIHKDRVNAEEVKKKAKQTLREHPENNSTRIEYWLKRTNGDYEEAERLLSERQTTFSRENCILKYGLEEGIKRWEERQVRWQDTLNSKPEEEKCEILRKKSLREPSNIELIVQDILEELYGKENISFQFPLIGELGDWVFDFKLFDKILIEVQGDYWHMNPKIYEPTHILRNGIEAKDVWKKDENKILDAKFKGYNTIIIWESDIYDSIQKVKERIITEVKELNK